CHHVIELGHGIDRSRSQTRHFAFLRVIEALSKADIEVIGMRGNLCLSFISNSAFGNIDDSTQADGVIGVFYDAQVRDDVTNLATLIKPRAAYYLVGNASAHEDIF